MSYDAVGNVVEAVKPSGTMTAQDATDGLATYAYDAANRLTATSFSDETAGFTYDYSSAGRLVTAARVQEGTVVASSVNVFDDAGRTVSTQRTGPGASTANYSYSDVGRLSGTSWSTGVQAAYSYNSAGELTTVTPSGLGNLDAVEYGYDPTGRVSTVTRAGQIMPTTTAVGYDAAGQLSSLQHATGASVVDDYAVARDLRGNPTEVATTTATSTTTSLYSFDGASRLRSECYPTTGETCTNRSPRVTYRYDKVGNRIAQSDRTVSGNKATTVKTASVYDAGDQLVSQSIGGVDTVNNTWSPNGELATSTTSAGTSTFTNDLTGELVSAALADGTVVDYTHDVTGNRTSRSVDGVLDVTWAWDNSSALPVRIGEYDQNNELATAWLPDPTSPTGAPLAATTGTVSSWLLSDPFANLTTTIDSSTSTVSGTRTMSVFGADRAPATGAMVDGAFGFAGQYLDEATGLYDMRARDYNSTTGRFTANDPVPVPTGIPFVGGYSYAYNNALIFSDASGLKPIGQFDYADGGSYRPANHGTYRPSSPQHSATSDSCGPASSRLNDFLLGAGVGGDGVAQGGFVSQYAVDFSLDDTSPWTLGVEWLTGSGPREHYFGDGSDFSNLLAGSDHYQGAYARILELLDAGKLETGVRQNGPNPYYQWDYTLEGVEGVGKYIKDYSTLLTGGTTGNLALTFLGSHNSAFVVNNITSDHVDATFLAWNNPTLESGTRPPVIGYEEWWTSGPGKIINSAAGDSGPMSPTTQYVMWDVRIDR